MDCKASHGMGRMPLLPQVHPASCCKENLTMMSLVEFLVFNLHAQISPLKFHCIVNLFKPYLSAVVFVQTCWRSSLRLGFWKINKKQL